MKKTILNLILILPILIGSITTMNAQNNWFIGVESALLSSGIENQNPYGMEKLPTVKTYGTSHNLVIGKTLNRGFAVSLEPTYAQLGQNYLHVRTDNDYLRNIGLNYIQMPLMLSKNFGQGKLRIQTKGGLYGSYLIESTFEESTLISEGNIVGPAVINVNSDRFNKLDLGVKAYLGAQLTLSEKLALNMSYSFSTSFSDINSDSYQYEPEYKLEYKKSRNVSTGIHLGLQYKL